MKYSPELIDKITRTIAQTGRDADGYSAAQISKRTFYQWMTNRPEFKAAVETAREQFRSQTIPEFRRLARLGVRRTLEAAATGLEIVKTQQRETIAPDGAIVTLETITREPAMVPVSQAVAYALSLENDGKKSITAWLAQGAEFGFIPPHVCETLLGKIRALESDIARTLFDAAPTEQDNKVTVAWIEMALGIHASQTESIRAPKLPDPSTAGQVMKAHMFGLDSGEVWDRIEHQAQEIRQ
jgi:hypothetical protein